MTPLERAAQALSESLYALQQSAPEIDAYRHIGMAEYGTMVRAVLTAIREPSSEVVMAAYGIVSMVDHKPSDVREMWGDMIDAALEEG